MIRINKKVFWTDEDGISIITERIKENTCKTNINPELMFRQSYTGITGKLFVGNWTSYGFWISKYRHQFIQFRPDIITRFYFIESLHEKKIEMKSSIGFSSILFFLIIILVFSSSVASEFGDAGFFSLLIIFSLLYILLTKIEYENMLENIKSNILNNINITKSDFDINSIN